MRLQRPVSGLSSQACPVEALEEVLPLDLGELLKVAQPALWVLFEQSLEEVLRLLGEMHWHSNIFLGYLLKHQFLIM